MKQGTLRKVYSLRAGEMRREGKECERRRGERNGERRGRRSGGSGTGGVGDGGGGELGARCWRINRTVGVVAVWFAVSGIFNFGWHLSANSISSVATTSLAVERENTTFALARQYGCPAQIRVNKKCKMSHMPFALFLLLLSPVTYTWDPCVRLLQPPTVNVALPGEMCNARVFGTK
jgi:hypothetical protein